MYSNSKIQSGWETQRGKEVQGKLLVYNVYTGGRHQKFTVQSRTTALEATLVRFYVCVHGSGLPRLAVWPVTLLKWLCSLLCDGISAIFLANRESYLKERVSRFSQNCKYKLTKPFIFLPTDCSMCGVWLWGLRVMGIGGFSQGHFFT